MLILTITLIVLLLVFLFSIRLFQMTQATKPVTSPVGLGIFAVILLATTVFSYGWLVYEPERLDRLVQFEALLPDVQVLLESNQASDSIKELDAASFVSLLGYYGKTYPKDDRVWQKLAVVMLNLEQHDASLKAVRRYLRSVPDDIQARQLEIQLLTTLIRDKKEISPRQLLHALEEYVSHADIAPEDRLYSASLAEEFGFDELAVSLWQSMLAADKRSDSHLSERALQGRQLVQTMLERSLARLNAENNPETKPLDLTEAVDQALPTSKVAQNILDLSFQLTLSPKTQVAIEEYQESSPLQPFQVWLSLSRGGPPMAARLVWFESAEQLQSVGALTFTESDLVLVPQELQDSATLRAVLALEPEKIDPLQARESPWQAAVEVNLTSQADQKFDLVIESSLVK